MMIIVIASHAYVILCIYIDNGFSTNLTSDIYRKLWKNAKYYYSLQKWVRNCNLYLNFFRLLFLLLLFISSSVLFLFFVFVFVSTFLLREPLPFTEIGGSMYRTCTLPIQCTRLNRWKISWVRRITAEYS